MSVWTNVLEQNGFSIISGGRFIPKNRGGAPEDIPRVEPYRLRKSWSLGTKYAVAVAADGMRWAIRIRSPEHRKELKELFSSLPFKSGTEFRHNYDGGMLLDYMGKKA